jgi:hypothetical protein
LEEHTQLDPTKTEEKNTDWPLFPFYTSRGTCEKTQVPKLMYTVAEKPRSTYTAIMWWPGFTYSLEGSNRTNTIRQVRLSISGAEVKFLLASSPLHTQRAAGCKNMAQKRDLATNLEKNKIEKTQIFQREIQYISRCLL